MDLPFASRATSGAGSATRWPDREGGPPGAAIPALADLAQALRTATRDLHHVVDHHPLLAPLVRDGLTRQQYGQALRVLLWLYEPLQASLAVGIAKFAGGYDLADRVSWLRSDLAFLGIPADMPPGAWTAPAPIRPAELAGMLYVVEGSTLGGQVIARQLAASLGVGAVTGATFFTGWGDETAARWQAFLAHAANLANGNTAEACAAAVGLFEALLQGFDAARHWMDVQCN